MTTPERLRLFIAVELPDEWRRALAEQERRLEAAAPGFGRWVDPRLMHVTLAFLGNQATDLLPRITGALDRAAGDARPFTLALSRLGWFGGPRSVRVVWQGVDDAPRGALAGLREAVVRELGAEPIWYDSAPFRPHITLARARRDASAAQSLAIHEAILWSPALSGQAEVADVALVRSELRPSGPIYTTLHRTQLNGIQIY